jgi:hypothetical protein
MSLHWPSSRDIVLGGTVPPPFADIFNELLPFQCRLSEKEQAYHAAIFGASGSANQSCCNPFSYNTWQKVMV